MADCEIVGDCQSEVIAIGSRKRKLESDDIEDNARVQMMAAFDLTTDQLPDNLYVRKVEDNNRKSRVIREYFDNSNRIPNLRIVTIWQVIDLIRWTAFAYKRYDGADNWLLWHGTKRRNLEGILRHGLGRPGGVPRSWVYLADRVALSSSFTDGNGQEVPLLCQVSADSVVPAIPGYLIPDKNSIEVLGNCKVPSGHTIDNLRANAHSRTFNEYMISEPDRILVNYVVECTRQVSYQWPRTRPIHRQSFNFFTGIK